MKQAVFGEIEQIVAEDAILATNTSSLSVEEIGAKLAHPERLVGFHFFNPVAVMPLIEIVKTPQTTDAALSTAFVVAKGLGKNAVLTADAPGFVVNRLLAKVMGEAARAVYEGTPLLTVEKAFGPLGLPMTPVPAHRPRRAGRSPRTCRTRWRTPSPTGSTRTRTSTSSPSSRKSSRRTSPAASPAGRRRHRESQGRCGSSPSSEDEILRRVQDGLADRDQAHAR